MRTSGSRRTTATAAAGITPAEKLGIPRRALSLVTECAALHPHEPAQSWVRARRDEPRLPIA